MFLEVLDKHRAPIRTMRARNKGVSLPWVNIEIKQEMRERDRPIRKATINRANIITVEQFCNFSFKNIEKKT